MQLSETARKLDWLDRSLLHARRITDPVWRTMQLRGVLGAISSIGNAQRARPLVAEARQLSSNPCGRRMERTCFSAVAQALGAHRS